MTALPPEDFTGEVEVDDATQLAARRRAPMDDELDDATQLSQRHVADPLADDSAMSGDDDAELEDATRLSARRTVPEEDDSTQLAARYNVTASPTAPSELQGHSSVTQAAAPRATGTRRGSVAMPPGEMRSDALVREGGFGSRSEAYSPRATAPTSAALPPPVDDKPSDTAGQSPVLTPRDAQRRRDSEHRASVGKAVAIGIVFLVVGVAAVIGIILLVGSML